MFGRRLFCSEESVPFAAARIGAKATQVHLEDVVERQLSFAGSVTHSTTAVTLVVLRTRATLTLTPFSINPPITVTEKVPLDAPSFHP